MRTARSPLLALLLLSLCAPASFASELRLRWDACYGDGGASNVTFACGDAIGEAVLVGSFVTDQTITQIDGLDIVIDVTSRSSTLPAWWDFTPGGCRQGGLGMSIVRPLGASACADRYRGHAAGGIASYQTYATPGGGIGGPDRARILLSLGVAEASAFTAEAGQEIFAFQVQFEHAPWTGSDACDGCSTPVCIAWGQAYIQRTSGGDVRIAGADTPGSRSNVTWQPGAVATTYGGCPPGRPCDSWVECLDASTPAPAPTWGRIKALYR